MTEHSVRSELSNSLWVATAPPGPDLEPLEGDHKADVVVVGAGFTGLRASLMLAEAGVDTIVIDAQDVGWGASGRNGGQVNPMMPHHSPDEINNLVGNDFGSRICQTGLESADEIFDLIRRYEIACGARQTGWLRVAHCPSAAREFLIQLEGWGKAGAEFECLEGEELAARTGSKIYNFGAFIPKGGCVQPLALARGVAKAAIGAGARMHRNSPVTALNRQDSGWRVRTPEGHIQADTVILCVNGYADKLWRGLAQSILPLTPINVATVPLNEGIAATILPAGAHFSDTRRTISYGRIEPDRRFVLGGLARSDDHRAAPDMENVRREAVRLFPQLEGVKWEFEWGGRIALTQDFLPHLHEPAPGILIGLGYNGRGVAMAHVMGRVMAQKVLGAQNSELPFPVSNIKRHNLHWIEACGLKDLAMKWIAFRDWAEVRMSS